MKQSHVIAFNAVIIWGTTVLQIIPQLILVPFLIDSIGESGYGLYALVWSLLVGIERLEMSLQSGMIKYSAAYLAQGQLHEVNRLLSSTFVFSIFLALLSSSAIFSAAVAYIGTSREMSFSLAAVGLMMLLLVPTTPYLGIIKSLQRNYIDSLARTLSQYAGLLLVVLWFQLVRPSVEALIVISGGSLLFARIVQLPVAYRLVPGLCNRPGSYDRKTISMVTAFGVMIVLSALCGVANTTGMRWLTGALVSTAFVAHLAIVLMPGVLLSQIVQAATITIMPAASVYQASGKHRMLKDLFLGATRYVAVLVMAALMAAVLLIHSVLALWVGARYEFLGGYALVILCSVAILESSSAAHHMLKGFGELRKILLAFTIGLVIIPAAIFLVIFLIWKSPYLAVTAGLSVGNIVCGIMQLRFCMSTVKVGFRELLMHAYVQPLLASGAILALALGAVAWTGTDGFAGRAAIGTAAVLLYLASFYLFIASSAERLQCRGFVQAFLGRILLRSARNPDA